MIYGILFIAIVCLVFGFVAGFLHGRTSEMRAAIEEMKRQNDAKRAELAIWEQHMIEMKKP